ncbi:MAG: pyruvate kinase alpha/beta domain-containing protein [Clostridia bacterium]
MIGFEHTGKENTEATVKAVLEYAEKHHIQKIVVASSKGETAKHFLNCGKEVMVVTHQTGYKDRGVQEFPEDLRRELTDSGMQVLTTTHFLAGADRALNHKFGGIYPAELIAHTLRILGQGFKVCVEVSVMAMDAGFIGADEDIIAVGGSARGADTAVLLRPGHSQSFFDTDVKDIICMPKGHRENA